MKAVRANQWCQPDGLVLEEIPDPKVLAGEVLIKVHAAALNYPDVLMIQGTYQVKPPLPFTPGFELSGEVVEVGPGVEGIEPGQKVMAQCDTGAFAEYVVVPYVTVRPVPEGMTMHQAAAFPLVYQTSYFGLAYRGQLRPDESVLVHSAAGGVGLAAVQIARAMGAGKIIGTAGSEAKLQAILDNGADEAIDYETQDFVPLVTQATEGRGADVIYDPVGGQIGQRSTKCIAFEGRIVIVGFTSGEFTDFRSNHILIKNYSVVGLHWGFYRQMNPAKIEQGWHELMQLYAGGGLTPHIGGTYPMENVAQAMKHLLARKAVGKLVLHW